MISSITVFEQVMKSNSVGYIPQWIANLKNYSITIAILLSGLNVGLLPAKRAANTYKQGISIGKLKGVITPTPP